MSTLDKLRKLLTTRNADKMATSIPGNCLLCFRRLLFKQLPSPNSNAILCSSHVKSERRFTTGCCAKTTSSSPPKKVVFSGIQPTGALHLGNYFGAVHNWLRMQSSGDNLFLSIVDLHSITLPQDPIILRENILRMTASLLACGIDPQRSTLFLQSDVPEHTELAWVLSCLTTMAKLGHLPQYKEKSVQVKEIPLGLFVYPVLQCADILLYKATHVPVGSDQLQHIHLTQSLAKIFNRKYGYLFPHPEAEIVNSQGASRIRSLKDPSKKMSKSDPDPKSRIELTDSLDVIRGKTKKAISDFTPSIHYDPELRPAISNLVNIHCLVTGQRPEEVCEEVCGLDTVQYKSLLAGVIDSWLSPIRTEFNRLMDDRSHLEVTLREGAVKARHTAGSTWASVRSAIGLL